MVKMTIINIICGLFFSCYGSPDSFFVNIVGRDLENFYDGTANQEAAATLPGGSHYYFIYVYKTYDKYRQPGDAGDKAFLILKDTGTNSEKVLMEGTLGYDFQFAAMNEAHDKIIYTLHDIRDPGNITYLYQQNVNNDDIQRWPIIDGKEYEKLRDKEMIWGGARIKSLYYNPQTEMVYYHVQYVINKNLHDDGNDFYRFDISAGSAIKIPESEYIKEKEPINNTAVGYTFSTDKETKKLFSIFPSSDYLPANYKRKYDGVYIADGTTNVRISKISGMEILLSQPYWIEAGTLVVCGSYLYDVTGKKKERKLAEGTIIFAAQY